MRLSIIIPIYNAEKYLSKCLDEVLSYSSIEMECILINDGSTDSSLDICEAYRQKDSRFKIIDKPNEGVSVARNTGIASATGKYVMFLDADDYIDSDKWSHIIEAMDQELDFIAFSYYTLFENGNITEELFKIESRETRDINTIRKLLLGSAVLNTCWGKLFKLNIIKNNHVLFRKGLKTGEDAIFILEYFERANTFLLMNESVLYYRQHAESVMHKLDIYSNFADFKELFNCRRRMLDLWNDGELKQEIYRESFSVITNLLLKFSLKNKMSESNRVFKKLMEDDLVRDILIHAKLDDLRPVYKKIEFILMKKNNMVLLSFYFKTKSIFM